MHIPEEEIHTHVHADGTVLFQLEGHQAHASVVFTPGVLAAFEDELVNHETGRESVKVFYGQPAPHDLLVQRLQRLRAGGARPISGMPEIRSGRSAIRGSHRP